VAKNAHSHRILVAPLHWGLGHVTRCIPIIQYLRAQGHEVILASDGDAKALLQLEFPDLLCIDLPAYQISYRTQSMVLNVAMQLPRLARTVRQEHAATQQIIQKHGITAIISDNRFGCWSSAVPSFFMTHQLQIQSKNRLAEKIGNWLMQRAMRNFHEIWVPDYAEPERSLAGVLSHSHHPSKPVRYLGPLSRMSEQPAEQAYDVIVVLSGPEPQRSKLEAILLEQALALPMQFLFVQGKPQVNRQYFASEHIEVVSYLTTTALNAAINSSEAVVCRSGYSSIMDLAVLGKKALLIPTPGQTEQEYLAEYFAEGGVFPYQKQEAINLEAGLALLTQFTGIKQKEHTLFGAEVAAALNNEER
jgi:uncharacterized protein (TIGR00661 family)